MMGWRNLYLFVAIYLVGGAAIGFLLQYHTATRALDLWTILMILVALFGE